MMKKSLLALALLLSGANLFPYEYTFYNATNASVFIDPYWSRLSLANEQMFQGNNQFNPNNINPSWPERLKGPVELKPRIRYKFVFNTPWCAGLCFDRIFVGWSQYNIMKADVKIAQSSQFNRIMNAANSFTGDVSGAAKSAGEAAGEFGAKGKAVQAVAKGSGEAAEKLVSGITKLISISQCGNLDFMIATDVNNNLSVIIQK